MEKKIISIINLILENKNLNPIKELDNKVDLRNNLAFDSFDLAELTVRVESEFGIDIFEDGIVSTIGDVLKKIKNNEK